MAVAGLLIPNDCDLKARSLELDDDFEAKSAHFSSENNQIRFGGVTGITLHVQQVLSDRTVSIQDPLANSLLVQSTPGQSVAQATSISTAVTLNALSGRILTVNPALAAGARASFTLNNNQLSAGRNLYLTLVDYANHSSLDTGFPLLSASGVVGNGTARINIFNNSGADAINDQLLIGFLVA